MDILEKWQCAFYPSVCEESIKKLVTKEEANAVCNPEHLQGFESQQNNLCCHNLEKLYKLFSKCDERLPVESTNSLWMKAERGWRQSLPRDLRVTAEWSQTSQLFNTSRAKTDAFNPVKVSTAWKFMNNSLFAPGTQRGKVMRRRAHTSERNEAHSDYIREKICLLKPMFNTSFFTLNRY